MVQSTDDCFVNATSDGSGSTDSSSGGNNGGSYSGNGDSGSSKYDFLVTLVNNSPDFPYYNQTDSSTVYAVNGVAGRELYLLWGQTYTFNASVSYAHSFYI
jgi:hypothetical protein